jgi:hypothetical protein
MKNILLIIAFCLSSQLLSAQQKDSTAKQPDPTKKLMEVEASCGQCKLGLEGTDCDLAVKIDGKAYYVDGTKIDDHGDAHAKDGFCNAIRKAKVQGEVVNNRFVATYFKLLPEKKK